MSVNLVNGDTLDLDFTAIADVIRTKTGSADTIPYSVGHPENFVNPIKTMMVMPTKTVRGSVAHFEDGEDAPLKTCTLTINPTQSGSGEPSPTNPRPISGFSSVNIQRTGKNLFNVEGETLEAYLLSDGTVRNDATAVSWNLSDYISVKEGETYYFNPNTTAGSSAKHGYYDASKNFVSSINSGASSFTVPSGVSFMRFSYRDTSTDIQLELGSTATAYESFEGDTYPVSFSDTVYGGEVEVVGGALTITDEIIDMGSISWTYTNGIFRGVISDGVILTQANIIDFVCSCYLVKGSGNSSKWTSDNLVCWHGTGSYCYIYVNDTNYNDPDIFQTAVTGQKLVYKLATPTTSLISPVEIDSLNGVNNLWCNTGDCEVEYYTPSSGSVTPIFSSTVLVDNTAQDTSFTLSDDYENYDFIAFEITSSTLGTKRIVTVPEVITDAFTYSSGKFNLNFWNSNNYCCYSHSGNTWTRTNNRYSNITKVIGIKCTNATVNKTMVYEKQAITATGGVITSATSLFEYDYLFFATCSGDATETQPCNTPISMGQKEIMEGCTFVENKYNQLNTFTITEFAVDTWVNWFMCVGIKFT